MNYEWNVLPFRISSNIQSQQIVDKINNQVRFTSDNKAFVKLALLDSTVNNPTLIDSYFVTIPQNTNLSENVNWSRKLTQNSLPLYVQHKEPNQFYNDTFVIYKSTLQNQWETNTIRLSTLDNVSDENIIFKGYYQRVHNQDKLVIFERNNVTTPVVVSEWNSQCVILFTYLTQEHEDTTNPTP